MADEQIDTARARTAEARRAERTAGLYYLLAGCAYTAIITLLGAPAVYKAVARWAWQFGNWSSFPFPYDLDAYMHYSWDDTVSFRYISMIVGSALMAGIAVAVLHTSIFGVVVLAYKWLGWPRYWQEVKSRFLLRSLWATSARRSWWLWPTMFAVFLILGLISTACYYIFYPIVGNGWPYSIASTVAVFLAFGIVSARTVRNEVLHRVEMDNLRCMRCGYLLKGLTQPRCPECGSATDGRKRYGLLRWRRRPSAETSKWVTVALIVLLALSPVWVPLGVVSLPRPWLRYVPMAIRPDLQVITDNPNRFPIRVDAYCVIEHEDSVALIRFTGISFVRTEYRVAYWNNRSAFESQRRPDSYSGGKLTRESGRTLSIGPWEFTHTVAGESFIWLNRPDSSFDISAFMRHDVPDELRFVITGWDEW